VAAAVEPEIQELLVQGALVVEALGQTATQQALQAQPIRAVVVAVVA